MARRETVVLDVIRCGESTWNSDGRIQGAADLPLSDEGRASVAADATRLSDVRPGVIFHPGDEAATETAGLVADAAGAKTREVTDLGEPDLGLLEGLTESEFHERFPKRYKQWQDDPVSVSPPEGEEVIEARLRLLGAVARLLRRSRHDEIGIVLHPFGLGLLHCWLTDRPAGEMWSRVKNRPRLERYLMTAEMIELLEAAAAAQPSGAR